MDHIWNVPDLPVGETKIRAGDYFQMGGGMAATAAVAVARLGAQCLFWARAGDDPAGRATRDEFERYGVDITNYRLFARQRTSTSAVFVNAAGERMIVNFRGAGLPRSPDWLPLDEVARADAVLADVRWVEGLEAMFGAARANNVPTILDGEIGEPHAYERILPLTDYAILSQIGLASLGYGTGESAIRAVRAMGARTVAVTLGAAGSLWLHENRLMEFEAFPVEVVDTTGAGDVFHGAFAYAVGAGATLEEAVVFSAAVAALKCAKAGGVPAFPISLPPGRFWREPASESRMLLSAAESTSFPNGGRGT